MMNDSKHTPGPWRYVRTNGSQTTGERLISGARPGYLAEIRDCGSGDVVANARLIAAAPDMLAALRAVLKECGPLDSDPDAPGTLNAIGRIARAAIAKAERGQ